MGVFKYAGVFLAGMLFGAMAAGGTTLFLTPMSGKKMRRRVRVLGQDLQDEALDRAEQVQGQVRKMWRTQNKKVVRVASDLKDNALDKAQDLGDRSQKAIRERGPNLLGILSVGRNRIIERM